MKTQMELGFENRQAARVATPRRRIPGANWWFQQMHVLVDQAFDWSAPAPRPEQIYFALRSRRNFKTA